MTLVLSQLMAKPTSWAQAHSWLKLARRMVSAAVISAWAATRLVSSANWYTEPPLNILHMSFTYKRYSVGAKFDP
jgi:hypothetical protein